MVATVAVALVVVPAALAHATLVSSTPSDGAVLVRAPKQVVLAFNEPVESALGSVRVYDGGLDRVDDGVTTKPEPSQVAVGVRSGLPRGTYTVAWRVISADSHPVHGAFVFSVGHPSAGGAGVVEQVLAGQAGSKDVDLVFGVIRFLNLALILLCAGGAIVLAWVLQAEPASVGRPLWPVLSVAGLLLALVSVAGIGLEGAQASGLGLGSALRPSLFGDVVDTRFGRVWLVRAGLALAFALFAALALRRERQRRAFAWYAVALGAALALTPALSGHARVEGPLGVVSDWVHVLAASAWTGGLAFVLLALLLASGDRWDLARRIVPRFSALAVISVALLLVAGVVSGFLEVRTWSGLWSTTYGQLLLVKVALVVPLLLPGRCSTTASRFRGFVREPPLLASRGTSWRPSGSSSQSWSSSSASPRLSSPRLRRKRSNRSRLDRSRVTSRSVRSTSTFSWTRLVPGRTQSTSPCSSVRPGSWRTWTRSASQRLSRPQASARSASRRHQPDQGT